MEENNANPNPQPVGGQQDTIEAPRSVFLGRGETVTLQFHGGEFKARKLAISDTDLIKLKTYRGDVGPFRAYLMAFYKAIETFHPEVKLSDIIEDITITDDEMRDLIMNQMPKVGFSLAPKKKEMNPPSNSTQESPDLTSTTQNSSDTQVTL